MAMLLGLAYWLLSLPSLAAALKFAANEARLGNEMPEDAVCLSIAAYEEAEWIDALIANALKMTEASTHIALHLNRRSTYSDDDLRRWNSTGRVSVTGERLYVEAFHGALLYSHLANIKTLPSSCKYVVLQASNVMWVRHGMERVVRKAEFGGFKIVPGDGFVTNHLDHIFFQNLTTIGQSQFAWGIHEGSFYETDVVKKFISYIDAWLADQHLDMFKTVLDAHGPLEEIWLQTFVVNTHNWNAQKLPAAPSLTFRDIHTMDNTIQMPDVRAVMDGKLPQLCLDKPDCNPCVAGGEVMPKEGFFSVKRVSRDVHDPITSFILNLK